MINLKILKGALEKEILFQSETDFKSYIKGLLELGIMNEVVRTRPNEDGTFTAIIREEYNKMEFLE